MTLATITDRTLALATRVTAAYLVGIQVADNEMMAGVVGAIRGILEPMAEFIAMVDRLYGPAVRSMNRYTVLRQHRRHQDGRRCYAKQARRERTGWRQI